LNKSPSVEVLTRVPAGAFTSMSTFALPETSTLAAGVIELACAARSCASRAVDRGHARLAIARIHLHVRPIFAAERENPISGVNEQKFGAESQVRWWEQSD
jgi:hypothetical protein